jgi:hypothetical protein
MSTLRRVTAAVSLTALVLVGLGAVDEPAVGAAPAQAQCGNVNANPTLTVDRPTIGVTETAVVTVTGRSYLQPPHVCGTNVFGGIYLFFGWVQPGGQWGPSFKSSTSTQGLFGTSYSYPGEGGGAETRDDGTGTIRLISFTAGGESGTSTPFHMDGQGNWQSNLTVRGATYSYTDLRTGASNSVDCRIVQCGVFTIGAHGKSSRTNERFTPINFVDAAGTPIVPSNPAGGGAGGATSVGAPTGGGGGDAAVGGAVADRGAAPGAAVAPETTAPAQVGTVGEAPTTTEAPETGGDAAEPDEVLEVDETASVQEFGADGGGGGAPTGLLVGAAVLLVMMLAAGGAIVLRIRAGKATGEVVS